jgi:hypothetical protein
MNDDFEGPAKNITSELIPVAIADAAVAQTVSDHVEAMDKMEAAGDLPAGTADAFLAKLGVTRETLAAAVHRIAGSPVEVRERVHRVAREGFEAAVTARSRRFPAGSPTFCTRMRGRRLRLAPRPRESRAGRGGFARSLSPPAAESDEPHPSRLVALLRALLDSLRGTR